MFKPIPSKNNLILAADNCGLAVNTNISPLPNFFCLFKARSANGPFLPFTTLLNSLKSNSAPSCCNCSACAANSAGVILVILPSGILTKTLLSLNARVSSKSNTLIPFVSLLYFLPSSAVVSASFIALIEDSVSLSELIKGNKVL